MMAGEDLSWRERLARLGRVQAMDRVPSGSPAAFVLVPRVDRRGLKTVTAAIELARRGLSMLDAKRAMDGLVERGEARVDLPVVEDVEAVRGVAAACGIGATPVGAPAPPRPAAAPAPA